MKIRSKSCEERVVADFKQQLKAREESFVERLSKDELRHKSDLERKRTEHETIVKRLQKLVEEHKLQNAKFTEETSLLRRKLESLNHDKEILLAKDRTTKQRETSLLRTLQEKNDQLKRLGLEREISELQGQQFKDLESARIQTIHFRYLCTIVTLVVAFFYLWMNTR